MVRLSCGYALGIVLLYVALGAVVTATLGAAGINNIAANPWVNLGIFAVFVVFAFSFFETIQLTLPANLTAMQATAKSHGGLVGLALLGITFVLASFTCTAPFLGTLLVAAAGGARFQPLLGMLVFALAFVSPFLVFAAFPQWISKIPKGGLWLARVKATLGFLELAARAQISVQCRSSLELAAFDSAGFAGGVGFDFRLRGFVSHRNSALRRGRGAGKSPAQKSRQAGPYLPSSSRFRPCFVFGAWPGGPSAHSAHSCRRRATAGSALRATACPGRRITGPRWRRHAPKASRSL